MGDSERTGAAGRQSVVVGLLADEGMPAQTAQALAGELAQVLHDRLSAEVVWDVDHRSEPLPLDADGRVALLELAERTRDLGWDTAILLTDLPRRTGTRPVVAGYSVDLRLAVLSMPAVGAWRVRHRTRDLVVHLLGHLFADRLDLDGTCTGTTRPLRCVRHVRSDDEHVDEHLVLHGARGRGRLLAGLVLDNRPWRLVPHLAGATAAAAAAAAYGVATTSFWGMADALPAWRLGLINVVAIAVLATWLLLDDRLWERPAERSEREKARLYNVSTVLTLSIGVACMYVTLFVVALIAALAVVDGSYLAAQLGHPSSLASYASIVWLASSVGIVAGALGSSFESEEAVRKATYGKREREQRRSSETAGDDERRVDAR